MELVVTFYLAVFDRWNDGFLEKVNPYGRSHKVHTFEHPALPPQSIDDMTVQDRTGRMADEMQAHLGEIRKVRRLLAGLVEFHSSTFGSIRYGICILFHLAPDRSPWCGQ